MRTSLFAILAAAYMAATTDAIALEDPLYLAQDPEESEVAKNIKAHGLKHVVKKEKEQEKEISDWEATARARSFLNHVEDDSDKKKPAAPALSDEEMAANARKGLKNHVVPNAGKKTAPKEQLSDEEMAAKARAGLKPAGSKKVKSQSLA